MKKIITMLVVLMLAMAFSLSAVAESALEEEFHAAWDAFLAMEATMPENAEPGKVSRATTLRIFNSDLQLTLPTGCSLYSSTSTDAYYVDSQTGLLFAVSKMENYGSIADWKAVLEYAGQDVSYGYINDVLSVIGLTYDSGYQVSCFVNSGYTTYLIMCAGATYDQALYFIDILDTLCLASGTAPTATPTAAPTATPVPGVYQDVLVCDSGLALNMDPNIAFAGSDSGTDNWYDRTNDLDFYISEVDYIDSLNDAAALYSDDVYDDNGKLVYSVHSLDWIVYNDVPGLRAVMADAEYPGWYFMEYFFCADGKIYSIYCGYNSKPAIVDYYMRTIHWMDDDRGTLKLPGDITTVESRAFYKSDAYKAEIPYGCISIGSYAFAYSDGLIVAELPATVTSIDNTAFLGCSGELTIVAPAGSYAQTFAGNNGYHFCAAE
ncbi:MAG: leucine-rich repeat protein [Clostridia bacterium]|nr:leucine-rich repeat protein [Clostridia bacterium]